MRNLRRYAILAGALLVAGTAFGQSTSDILRMGQTNGAFSTARSAGMAGAFGSLGADAASITINPAGLGMYHSSESSITPMLQFANVKSESVLNGTSYSDKGNTVSASVANAALVLNLLSEHGSNRGLTSFNIAASYNRLNDFRSEQYSYSGYEDRSIGDVFAAQIYGLSPSSIYDERTPLKPYQNSDPYYWGGMLAYGTGLLFDGIDGQGNSSYQLGYVNEHGNHVGSLTPGDLVSPALYKDIKGYSSEFNLALGAELFSKLYLGMSFSFQDYSYNEYSYYSERADNQNRGDLAELLYEQSVDYYGSAFAFKFGANMEITKGWRVAAALHTPSYYTVDSEYIAAMQNYYFDDATNYYQETPYYLQNMKVNTPMRFIASTSKVLGSKMIISLDYERVWYNKMKVRDIAYNKQGAIDLTNEIADTYRATNNFRVGLERRFAKNFSARAGYAFYQSPYQDQTDYGSYQNLTFGLGYRVKGFYLDLAYVNTKSDQIPTKYYSDNYVANDGSASSLSTMYNESLNHNILLTLGFRY